MTSVWKESFRLYKKNFGPLCLTLLVQLVLRAIALSPVLFLADKALAPLAFIAIPLYIFIVLPARQNYAIALQNMLASCAGLVDTAMVARLGNVATSAVGIGGKWSFVLQMITFGFCSGGSVLISQYWGAQDHKGVRRAYSLGMGLCLIAAVLYNIAAALFPYEMICLFTDEEAVRQAGAEYLGIVCWGAIPLAFATIASMARRCVEDVRTPLLISGVSVCVNTFFNWCLIYGKCGLPQLGLRGAAVATVLSHVVQAILVIVIGVKQKHFTIYGLNEVLKIPSDFIRKYFHIALPVIGNETLWCVGFNIYAIVYAHQGSENYAAYTLYSSIENLVFVFFVGACNACSIMIGKSIVNKNGTTDIGELCLAYGGGGHTNAGTCQLDNDKVDAALPDIIARLNEHEELK